MEDRSTHLLCQFRKAQSLDQPVLLLVQTRYDPLAGSVAVNNKTLLDLREPLDGPRSIQCDLSFPQLNLQDGE